MKSREQKVGLLCILVATLLWSTAEVVVRTLLDRVTPIQVAAARFTFGSTALCLFLPFELRRRNLKITRKIVFHAMWLSLIGVLACSLTFQYSLSTTGAAVVATVWGSLPLLVMIMAVWLLGEPLTWEKVTGVTLGFLGIVFLAFSEESATFTLGGLILAILSVVAFGLFTVLVKKLVGQFAGLPFTAICFAFGAILLDAVAVMEADTAVFAHLGSVMPHLLYLGVCATGMSYSLYFVGVERVEATQAASVVLLKPPTATLLAWAVIGEPLTWNLAVGLVLILGGLYLVVLLDWRRRKGSS